MQVKGTVKKKVSGRPCMKKIATRELEINNSLRLTLSDNYGLRV